MKELTHAFIGRTPIGLGACLTLSCSLASATALRLSPSDIAHLGLRTEPAVSALDVEDNEGYAVVVGRELVAQTMADLIAAQATVRQSQAALVRMRRLAGTAGADSATARESAERQTTVDDALLELAQVRAFATWGRPLPASSVQSNERLRAIAAGRLTLVKITFPLGSFLNGAPGHVELRRFDTAAQAPVGNVTLVWPAPSDESMPGRSYFAAIDHSTLQAAEHLMAHAADASAQRGALIPRAALVISGTEYWYYVERESGAFERARADIHRPLAGGYFIASGITPGEAIVVAGAGLLLAYESNRGSSADP